MYYQAIAVIMLHNKQPPILSGLQPPAFLFFGSIDLLQFGLRQTVVCSLRTDYRFPLCDGHSLCTYGC